MDATTRIRRFNRAVAREIGALDTSYLGEGRPLGAARVLCAIGPTGRELADLRAELEIDAGLLSRLLADLRREGLVTIAAASGDRRRRRAAWTPAGGAEAARYDALSDARAERLLASLGRNAAPLLDAMDGVAAAFNRAHVEIAPADPDEPEARRAAASYFAELAARFEEGFDPARALQPDADSQRPPNGFLLLARADGRALGCIALRRTTPEFSELKRLWVAPEARGLGLARRLIAAAEDHARALGISTLRLDTNRALTEAVALYRSLGYADIPRFNAEPYAHHWFEKRL
jgi:GNAT superfamily N-acetyltransferase/DNA-binding MarR family transcriptional regulator